MKTWALLLIAVVLVGCVAETSQATYRAPSRLDALPVVTATAAQPVPAGLATQQAAGLATAWAASSQQTAIALQAASIQAAVTAHAQQTQDTRRDQATATAQALDQAQRASAATATQAAMVQAATREQQDRQTGATATRQAATATAAAASLHATQQREAATREARQASVSDNAGGLMLYALVLFPIAAALILLVLSGWWLAARIVGDHEQRKAETALVWAEAAQRSIVDTRASTWQLRRVDGEVVAVLIAARPMLPGPQPEPRPAEPLVVRERGVTVSVYPPVGEPAPDPVRQDVLELLDWAIGQHGEDGRVIPGHRKLPAQWNSDRWSRATAAIRPYLDATRGVGTTLAPGCPWGTLGELYRAVESHRATLVPPPQDG